MSVLVSRPDATVPVLAEVPQPTLGPTDVRIAVAAAAVNPVDVMTVSGVVRGFWGLDGDLGLGWDVSGTVAEVGADVTGFALGDAVAALHDGVAAPARTHADVVTVPAAAVAHLPAGLDPIDAGAIPLNSLTAAQALDLLGPAEGRTLLVTGAAGAVGGYAVALAARAGWSVTGLAREADREFVLGAGAKELATELPGPVFDAVLDAATMQEGAIAAVRDGGAFAGVLTALPVPSDRGISVSTVRVTPDGDRLAELLALSVDGTLAVRVAGRVPLAEAKTAYDQVMSGGQRGRWLLIP